MATEVISRLTVHTGPMFADKTTSLIRAYGDGKNVVAFKPQKDDRYSEDKIVSHGGESIPAVNFDENEPVTILALLPESVTKVLIDEVQFCRDEIIEVVEKLLTKNIQVVVAGLDFDSEGNEFGPTLKLVRMAEEMGKEAVVTRHRANCTECGEVGIATLTYAKPQKKKQVEVGGKNIYRPCCPDCYTRLRAK